MARPSGLLGLTPSLPEAAPDVRAQLLALHDVTARKDAAFFPPGTKLPRRMPPGTHIATRREGKLATADPKKATMFAKAPVLDDAKLARLLGYSEDKLSALSSGAPLVVEGFKHGGVVHGQLTSPAGAPMAVAAARRAAPGTRVRIVSPLDAFARQIGLLGKLR